MPLYLNVGILPTVSFFLLDLSNNMKSDILISSTSIEEILLN